MELPLPLLRALLSVEPASPAPTAVTPRILLRDLYELYVREEAGRTVDPDLLAGEDRSRCFGGRQASVPLSHRQNILLWMCDATVSIGWSYATLHTAVALFDAYIFDYHVLSECVAPRIVDDFDPLPRDAGLQLLGEELPSLSASCLYIGACLRECMIDQTILTVDEFRRICPEIGNARTIREQQLKILGALGGRVDRPRLPGYRTPYDLVCLFVQRLSLFAPTKPIYNHLVSTNAVRPLLELVMNVSTVCMLNTISLCLPPSSWIVATLLYVIQYMHPITSEHARTKPFEEVAASACDSAFAYPSGWLSAQQLLELYRPLIRAIVRGMNKTDAPTRPNTPAKNRQHIFSLPKSLTHQAICNYKSPLVSALRRRILPTLRTIQLASTAVINEDAELIRSASVVDQENVDDHRRNLNTRTHIRRHTSLCNCTQCHRYQKHPPDWREYKASL